MYFVYIYIYKKNICIYIYMQINYDIQLVTDTPVDPRTIDVDPVDHVDPPMFFRRDVC